MSMHNADQEALREEANRLYWESERGVNQIGDELDLSKGVLYTLIDPLPAGLPCLKCGEEMVFPNRTAREKGFLVCPACGLEEEETAVQAFWEGAADVPLAEATLDPGSLAGRAEDPVAPRRDSTAADHPELELEEGKTTPLEVTSQALVGTAILGFAAGIFVGALLRKR